MQIIEKLKLNLPFSYIWLLRSSIGSAKTILDLGCGDGTLMELLSKGKTWQITGIDIYQKAIEDAKKRNIYHKLIKGDLLKTIRGKLKNKNKYDVVFFSQVIEHLRRDEGERILEEIEKLASKRIVVGTPRGFMEQPHEFLDGNPHQVHKSGWTIEDFASRGYKVFGVGFWPIWSEGGLARTKGKLPFIFWTLVAYLFSIPVYFFPKLGSGILAVKNK